MSVIAFPSRLIADGPLAHLSAGDAREVLMIVQMVGSRHRLEMVVDALISLFDYEDDDADFEQTATETLGRGFAGDLSADDTEA